MDFETALPARVTLWLFEQVCGKIGHVAESEDCDVLRRPKSACLKNPFR